MGFACTLVTDCLFEHLPNERPQGCFRVQLNEAGSRASKDRLERHFDKGWQAVFNFRGVGVAYHAGSLMPRFLASNSHIGASSQSPLYLAPAAILALRLARAFSRMVWLDMGDRLPSEEGVGARAYVRVLSEAACCCVMTALIGE